MCVCARMRTPDYSVCLTVPWQQVGVRGQSAVIVSLLPLCVSMGLDSECHEASGTFTYSSSFKKDYLSPLF